jgi:tetratricopeptide (TPR) repeat protein/MinD-like ATPase involved in chromosome partitioning or flagellar assembly
MSRIVTFYSYKGGVGRTLAMANIGILLARRGRRVLLMDWDLEAPGLDRYFRPHQTAIVSPDQGIVHLLHQAAADPGADWRPHVQTVRMRPSGDKEDCELSFIPSGVAAVNYAELVRRFSWETFLAEQDGGAILERWRNEWKGSFDLVLIDSRTGITDTGGICTILLPDFLVLVFTANEQSFEGTLAIAASAQVERRQLAVQRPPLMFLPLLSRFDRRDEIAVADQWLARFADGLVPLYADWLPTRFKPAQILEITKIPYVTRFSFGEPLPVLTHSLTDPELPGFYLEQCARLLDSDFSEVARILKGDSDDSQSDESIALGAQLGPRQAIRIYEQALTHARLIGDSQGEVDALVNLGNAYWALGDPQQAVGYFETSLSLLQQSGDRPNAGNVFGKLGLAYFALGAVDKAIGYYEQQLVIVRATGDQRGECSALGNLGNAHSARGDVAMAIGYYERALLIARGLGDRHNEANTFGNLGIVYDNLSQVEKAIEFYQQQLEIVREIGDRRGEGAALGNLGNAYANLGQVEKAIELYQQQLEIVREIGDRRGEGAALGNLGNAYANLGQVEKAIELYQQQLVIVREIGDRRGEGAALGNLGNAYANLGQVEKAIELYQQQLVIVREIGDRRGEGAALGNLGNAYAHLGHTEKAIEFYEQQLVIVREIGDRRGEGAALGNLGITYAHLGHAEKAEKKLQKAQAIGEQIPDPRIISKTTAALTQLEPPAES